MKIRNETKKTGLKFDFPDDDDSPWFPEWAVGFAMGVIACKLWPSLMIFLGAVQAAIGGG